MSVMLASNFFKISSPILSVTNKSVSRKDKAISSKSFKSFTASFFYFQHVKAKNYHLAVSMSCLLTFLTLITLLEFLTGWTSLLCIKIIILILLPRSFITRSCKILSFFTWDDRNVLTSVRILFTKSKTFQHKAGASLGSSWSFSSS